MIMLQPEVIVARVTAHLQEKNSLDRTGSFGSVFDIETPEDLTSSSKTIVNTHYNYWRSSRSWWNFLIGSLEYQSRGATRRGRFRNEVEARYYPPSWLLQTVFDVQAYNLPSGWCIKYRGYRVLPQDHAFCVAIRRGDIQTVQNLISSKTVSLNDRFGSLEESVLHVSY